MIGLHPMTSTAKAQSTTSIAKVSTDNYKSSASKNLNGSTSAIAGNGKLVDRVMKSGESRETLVDSDVDQESNLYPITSVAESNAGGVKKKKKKKKKNNKDHQQQHDNVAKNAGDTKDDATAGSIVGGSGDFGKFKATFKDAKSYNPGHTTQYASKPQQNKNESIPTKSDWPGLKSSSSSKYEQSHPALPSLHPYLHSDTSASSVCSDYSETTSASSNASFASVVSAWSNRSLSAPRPLIRDMSEFNKNDTSRPPSALSNASSVASGASNASHLEKSYRNNQSQNRGKGGWSRNFVDSNQVRTCFV
jgi:hypothetical protein